MTSPLRRPKETLEFPRHRQSQALAELPEAGQAEDTVPDYPIDATTRVLRTDLIVQRPVRATRDNSHLLPSVIVEPPERTLRIPLPPGSHVRPVDRSSVENKTIVSGRAVHKMPNPALIALLLSVGVLAARMLPVLGRWIEAVLGG